MGSALMIERPDRILAAQFKQNRRDVVELAIDGFEYHNRAGVAGWNRLVDIRTFDHHGGRHVWTKNGIVLRPSLILPLMDALPELQRRLEAEGLLQEGSAK